MASDVCRLYAYALLSSLQPADRRIVFDLRICDRLKIDRYAHPHLVSKIVKAKNKNALSEDKRLRLPLERGLEAGYITRKGSMLKRYYGR